MASGFAGGLPCCLGFLLLALSLSPAAAQNEPEQSVWDTSAIQLFRHLEFPRDLPSTGTVITEDKAGMIWIGTQDGLARWDGYRARVFRHDPQDPNSLPSNFVTALLVDNQGALFATVSTGDIVRFDPIEEQFRRLPSVTTATGAVSNALIGDGKGGLWAGNWNGLSHYDPEQQHWEMAGLPAGTRVSSLLLALDGTLWVGTENGLLRYDSETSSFTPIELNAGNSAAAAVRVLFQSTNGDIWFGKNDGSVGRVIQGGRSPTVDLIQAGSPVKGIAEPKPGILSIATMDNGLKFVEESSGKVIRSDRHDPGRPSGIGGNLIFSEFVDSSGGLWTTNEHGADYLAPGTDAFLSLLPSDRDLASFHGSNVSALAPLPDGRLWVSTEAGSEVISPIGGHKRSVPDQVDNFAVPGSLPRNFEAMGRDQFWISSSRGLFLSEKGQLKQIPAFADTPIESLLADGNILWVGTQRRGLARLDTTTNAVTFFSHDPGDPHSISDNWVYAMARDHKGRLWVATLHGLNKYEDGRFTQFHHDPRDPSSVPSDTIRDLLVDRENRLWLATQGGGAAVLIDESKIRSIPRASGMLNDNVGKLVEDDQGKIWGSTDTGLIRIDPTNFQARAFDATDGMAVSAYWVGSGGRLQDGTLVFGGVGGLTLVHPERLVEKKILPPPITATAAHVAGHYQSPLKPLILPSDDHNLQVDFAALDYAKPEKVSYSYKLAGFDKDWTETDSDHRQAVYTNLPPGRYTLLLRASESEGNWTAPPTQIPVTVLPTWYQTWLFKVFLALAALGVLVIFVRSRTALLRRRQKELEGLVAERTAEIASLLHNSGEGFLSFGPNLIIDRQYSRACETFLGEIPAGKNAAALLFAENPRHVAFVTESIPAALSASDEHKRDVILSLLPKEIDRRGRRLRLHYTIIENGHLMVVLRDITTERRLTERVASEHRRLEMIVAAVTDSRDFFDAVSNYELFINSELPEMMSSEAAPPSLLRDIYRSVHTFKGVFSQFSFEKTPAVLHQLEEQFDKLQQNGVSTTFDISSLLDLEQLTSALNQDLAVVRQAMGEEFLIKGGHVTMPPVRAARIKQLASLWRRGEAFDPTEPEIRDLLDEIERVGSISLKDELASYDQTIAQVARRMGKEVAPLALTCGEDIWLDPDHFGPFLRSLIHVFRNCVAHGVEPPEARIEAGKEELGQISCDVEVSENQLRIVIADDGAGIDIPALRRRVAQSGRIGSEKIDLLSDEEAVDFIFLDNISTAAAADDWAGRGVGLAAVRQEVERLNGTVSVETRRNRGTRFLFTLHLNHSISLHSATSLLRQSAS